MSIDYEACFGIGVEIKRKKFDPSSEYYSMEHYLDTILNGTPYEYDEYGNKHCADIEDIFIIIIKDPFKDGYNIQEKVKDMEIFLKGHNIEFDGIDVVGGLSIY